MLGALSEQVGVVVVSTIRTVLLIPVDHMTDTGSAGTLEQTFRCSIDRNEAPVCGAVGGGGWWWRWRGFSLFSFCPTGSEVCQCDRVGVLEEVISGTPGLWEMTPAVTPLTLRSAQLLYGCVGGAGVGVGEGFMLQNDY